jgi:hypothetical protein
MFPLSLLACGSLLLAGSASPCTACPSPPELEAGTVAATQARPDFAFRAQPDAGALAWQVSSRSPSLRARCDALVVEVRGPAVQGSEARVRAWSSIDGGGRVAGLLSGGPQRHWLLWESEARNRVELEQVARDLAAQPEVQFVSTLGEGLDGAPVWGSPRLLLKLHHEDPGAFTPVLAGMLAEARPWTSSGLQGAWTWETGLRTSFDVEQVFAALAPISEWVEVDAWFGGRSSATSSTKSSGAAPNDPLYLSQWHHDASSLFTGSDIDVDSPGIWEQTVGSPAQAILVIDSGVELVHPDLSVSAGSDWTGAALGGAPTNTFCEYHGTWVAGIASAIRNNGLGVAGVAPGARCLSARALIADPGACNGTWTTQVSWTVEALAWGAAQGATVTVNANEYGFEAQAIQDQYAALRAEGIAHVAAAGNSGFAGVAYPARLPAVIGVGACDDVGQRAWFSSSGPEVFAVAPGVEIWTTDPIGLGGVPFADYLAVSGTSAAAPIVAGGLALLQSLDPAADPDDL